MGRRGRPPNFDRHQVAAIVMEALQLGLPLISTLAIVLDTTEEKASRALRGAREGKHLGVGKHYPARAVIHRNSSKEHTYLACEHCLNPWPCPTATRKQTPP